MSHYNKFKDSLLRTLEMLKIRQANVTDAALIRRMIWELADFEKAPDEVRTTEADIARDGFGANPLSLEDLLKFGAFPGSVADQLE